MARPIKNEDEILEKVILFRIKNDDYKKLDDLFLKSNYNKKSDLYRDLMLKNEFKIISTDEEMFQIRNQMLSQVKKIGNNFNQLLKHFNQKKKDNFTEDDVKKMLELMKSIQYLYVEINDNFKL